MVILTDYHYRAGASLNSFVFCLPTQVSRLLSLSAPPISCFAHFTGIGSTPEVVGSHRHYGAFQPFLCAHFTHYLRISGDDQFRSSTFMFSLECYSSLIPQFTLSEDFLRARSSCFSSWRYHFPILATATMLFQHSNSFTRLPYLSA